MEVLYDVETQETIAARPAPVQISPAAITTGCGSAGTTGARLRQEIGGRQSTKCFNGTGILDGSWPNSVSLSAGAYGTSAWYNNKTQLVYASPGYTVVFTSPIYVISISRS